MFDLEEFIADCRRAAAEPEPWTAIRELLSRALADRASVAAALPATRAELTPLHAGPDVTIVKVVWAPRMTFPPHDHQTWACSGIYGGHERNRVHRLVDGSLVDTDGFDLDEGEVGFLDADAIHSVVNPRSQELSAAIHVYGGDFLRLPRTNWIGDPPVAQPADVEVTRAIFDAADAAR